MIDILRNTAKNGTLGTFQVNASSIKGTRPVNGKTSTSTATATATTPTSPSDSMCPYFEFAYYLMILPKLICLSVHFCFRCRRKKNMNPLSAGSFLRVIFMLCGTIPRQVCTEFFPPLPYTSPHLFSYFFSVFVVNHVSTFYKWCLSQFIKLSTSNIAFLAL